MNLGTGNQIFYKKLENNNKNKVQYFKFNSLRDSLGV